MSLSNAVKADLFADLKKEVDNTRRKEQRTWKKLLLIIKGLYYERKAEFYGYDFPLSREANVGL